MLCVFPSDVNILVIFCSDWEEIFANGPFSAFFNDFDNFNEPFLIILHGLLWAIFQWDYGAWPLAFPITAFVFELGIYFEKWPYCLEWFLWHQRSKAPLRDHLVRRLSHFWFADNFFTLRNRALIFGKCVPYDKIFPMVP